MRRAQASSGTRDADAVLAEGEGRAHRGVHALRGRRPGRRGIRPGVRTLEPDFGKNDLEKIWKMAVLAAQ